MNVTDFKCDNCNETYHRRFMLFVKSKPGHFSAYCEYCVEQIVTAFDAFKNPDCIYVRVKRPEGYEQVDDELMFQDFAEAQESGWKVELLTNDLTDVFRSEQCTE